MNCKEAIEEALRKGNKSKYWLSKKLGDSRSGYLLKEDMRMSTFVKVCKVLGYRVVIYDTQKHAFEIGGYEK